MNLLNYMYYEQNELQHNGTKGMKWNVLRYQNPDGTWTEEGKARRRAQYKKAAASAGRAAKKAFDRNIKNGKDKEKMSPAESIAKSSKNIIDNASALRSKKQNKKRQNEIENIKNDAKTLSDEDLRKTINRMNLEKQYVDLKSRDLSDGRDKVADILDTVGDVLAIGSSAAVLGSVVYNTFLKK